MTASQPPSETARVLIKAILWDLDDTLWDCRKTLENAATHFENADVPDFLKNNGVVLKLMNELQRNSPEIAHDYSLLRCRVFEQLLRENGRNAEEATAESHQYFKIWHAFRNQPVFFPDVLVELRRLKDTRRELIFGVITDGNADVKQVAGLNELIDGPVVTAQIAGCTKPNEAIFSMALTQLQEKHQVEPEEVLFVGDNWKADILGAHCMGMKTAYICKNEKKKKKKEKKDFGLGEEDPPTLFLSSVVGISDFFCDGTF